MIRTWDFHCDHCGQDHPSRTFGGKARIPKTIRCECGQRAGWASMKRTAQIHPSHSGLNYGQVNPQIGGEVVEDYAHKQRLLQEHGLVEGDIERRDDIEQEFFQRQQTHEQRASEPVLKADSPEEIRAQIPRDRIDWSNTSEKQFDRELIQGAWGL